MTEELVPEMARRLAAEPENHALLARICDALDDEHGAPFAARAILYAGVEYERVLPTEVALRVEIHARRWLSDELMFLSKEGCDAVSKFSFDEPLLQLVTRRATGGTRGFPYALFFDCVFDDRLHYNPMYISFFWHFFANDGVLVASLENQILFACEECSLPQKHAGYETLVLKLPCGCFGHPDCFLAAVDRDSKCPHCKEPAGYDCRPHFAEAEVVRLAALPPSLDADELYNVFHARLEHASLRLIRLRRAVETGGGRRTWRPVFAEDLGEERFHAVKDDDTALYHALCSISEVSRSKDFY